MGVIINWKVVGMLLFALGALLCAVSAETRQGNLVEASRIDRAVDTLWESNDTPVTTLWQPSGSFNVGDVVTAPSNLPTAATGKVVMMWDIDAPACGSGQVW